MRCASLLNRLGRKKWNVHLRARYAHGQGVAAYLARYLKGGPLKNSRLLPAEPARVRFRYRPHRDEDDASGAFVVMTLEPAAFLARYLTRLPQPGLQTVRGYGLYGQRAGARLDQARAARRRSIPRALRSNARRRHHRGARISRNRDADRRVSAVNRSYNTRSGVPRRARPTRRGTDTARSCAIRTFFCGVGQLIVRPHSSSNGSGLDIRIP